MHEIHYGSHPECGWLGKIAKAEADFEKYEEINGQKP